MCSSRLKLCQAFPSLPSVRLCPYPTRCLCASYFMGRTPRLRKSALASSTSRCNSSAAAGQAGKVATLQITVTAEYRAKPSNNHSGRRATACSASGGSGTLRQSASQTAVADSRRKSTTAARLGIEGKLRHELWRSVQERRHGYPRSASREVSISNQRRPARTHTPAAQARIPLPVMCSGRQRGSVPLIVELKIYCGTAAAALGGARGDRDTRFQACVRSVPQ